MACPDKPFVSSDKGTIKRNASVTLYETEITEAYYILEKGDDCCTETGKSYSIDDNSCLEDYIKLVRSLVTDVLGKALEVDEDFFMSGMDSLTAIKLRHLLVSSIKSIKDVKLIAKDAVHSNPTIHSLARFLSNSPVEYPGSNNADGDAIEDIIRELSVNFYTRSFNDNLTHLEPLDRIYAITGSTGSLGSALVNELLKQENVKKIYLLNRKSNNTTVSEKHRRMFVDKGLDYPRFAEAEESGRVVHCEISLSEANLGLNDYDYDKACLLRSNTSIFLTYRLIGLYQLSSDVTHIIHLAWPVSFRLSFSSYRDQLLGVRHLIDLASASKRPSLPHFCFISSIAVVRNWVAGDIVPEISLENKHSVLPCGYGQAKYAAEKILENAAFGVPGFRASIVRFSQISGALRTGSWSMDEYVPTIIRASFEMKVVPDDIWVNSLHSHVLFMAFIFFCDTLIAHVLDSLGVSRTRSISSNR